MEIKIKITSTTKDILNKYYAEDLLNTIIYNKNYKTPSIEVIERYKNKIIDTAATNTIVQLSEQTSSWLIAQARNSNTSINIIFNYLISLVADCSRVHSKNIKQALDCYYYAVENDKDLLKKILVEYGEYMGAFTPTVTLSDEGVASFLAISKKRSEYSE